MLRNKLVGTSAETRVQQNPRLEQGGNGLVRTRAVLPWMRRKALDNQLPLDPHPRLTRFVALRGHQATTQQKIYDLKDPTFKFVDKDDDLDFLCEDFKSPRALMSCGHAVTPTSLTNWCQRLLDQGKTRFVCGQTNCNVEWSYEEVCRMALLTPQEKMHFEKTMKNNAAKHNTKPCPGCKYPVVRWDQSNLRLHCSVCSLKNRRIYYFCWQCMREWRGPDSSPDHCGNVGCRKESLKTLESCPEIHLNNVKCPSIRACPSCGILLQHDKKACKNATCPRCKVYFCFVCLKVGCFRCSVAAPRQTSIPVWQKKIVEKT